MLAKSASMKSLKMKVLNEHANSNRQTYFIYDMCEQECLPFNVLSSFELFDVFSLTVIHEGCSLTNLFRGKPYPFLVYMFNVLIILYL